MLLLSRAVGSSEMRSVLPSAVRGFVCLGRYFVNHLTFVLNFTHMPNFSGFHAGKFEKF